MYSISRTNTSCVFVVETFRWHSWGDVNVSPIVRKGSHQLASSEPLNQFSEPLRTNSLALLFFYSFSLKVNFFPPRETKKRPPAHCTQLACGTYRNVLHQQNDRRDIFFGKNNTSTSYFVILLSYPQIDPFICGRLTPSTA